MSTRCPSTAPLDVQVRQDGGGYGLTLPTVLGIDPSGMVEAVGERVEAFQAGQRVSVVQPLQRGGGYAQYVTAAAEDTYLIPDPLSFAEATVVTRRVPMAFGLARVADLKAGEWVLIMGAAGALGSCAIQVAKQLGARVIAGAGADERLEVACSLGADYGVNYRQRGLAQEVMRITEGRGVEVVFENIADPILWPGAYDSLARGGRLVTVGAHGGGKVTLDVKRLYHERLKIMSGLGSIRPGDVERSLELAAAGEFRMLIRLVAENGTLGKTILDPTLP